MFEFGRDLRKLFTQARESDDLGWLELISADLLRAEARQQSIDAGRVSCPQPFEASLRAAALWREHMRRTGMGDSLERARRAVGYADRSAKDADQTARAAIEAIALQLLEFDLCGGLETLATAWASADQLQAPRRAETTAALTALQARIFARQARLSGDLADRRNAVSAMDRALEGLGPESSPASDELRLDRAGLALEIGVIERDPRLLDQAGRNLRGIVASARPEHRPLTRARALMLCGAGMKALAAVAADVDAFLHGQAMFDAATDQFTPDHSPLDWVAIQIVRADHRSPLLPLAQAQALSCGGGLILGALAGEMRFAREAAMAEADHDGDALARMEAGLRRRLVHRSNDQSPLDWAADQIAMAHVRLAADRLNGGETPGMGMILVEAAAVAREQGVPLLAERAERLMAARVAAA